MKSKEVKGLQPTPRPAQPGDPELSLIIVVYKTPEFLLRCLDSIARARIEPTHEIIVIDNAPGEGECRTVCEGREAVAYVPNASNVGFGRACNQGMRLARGRVFLLLNPDIEVLPGGVETLLHCLQEEVDAGIVAPRLHYADGTLQDSCRTFYTLPIFLLRRTFLGKLFPNAGIIREHLMKDWDHESTADVDWCLGASLMVRREAVADVGMMDERFFMYFEDVDWCNRMHQRGWKVLYCPAARMIHNYQRASAGWRSGKGLLIHLGSTLLYYEKWSFLLYWLKLRTRRLRQIALFASDLVMVALGFVLAYALRGMARGLLTKPLFAFELYLRFFCFTLIVAMGSFLAFGLYRERMRPSLVENGLPVARALGWTSMLMMAATFLFSVRMYSRIMVALFFPLSVFLVTLGRAGLLRLVESVRRREVNLRRVGLLGPEVAVQELLGRFQRWGRFGMEPVALSFPEGETGDAAVWLRRIRSERLAEMVIFEDWPGDLRLLCEALRGRGIPVRLLPTWREIVPTGARYADFMGWPSLSWGGSGAGGPLRSPGRRLSDLITAMIFGLFWLIPYLGVVLIRGLSGKPALQRVRLGSGPGSFFVRRLAGTRSECGFASTILHWYPALSEVAAGRMSVVGTYPYTEEEWRALTAPERHNIAVSPPGLVGPWTGGRIPLSAIPRWNQRYAELWSPAEDFRIFWRAVLAVREPNEANSKGPDARETA